MRNNIIFLWGISALFSGQIRQNQQKSKEKMSEFYKTLKKAKRNRLRKF